ncbi:Protein CBG26020 [Caenorhabditis briggsae]|uniref:Protein CBG26020 n=1 Tax=Caenorhabditis briggsae TaxID=6238 RepID=B6IGJ3_CAEBR|nr:Protein CBG26020 [Caenorhabditis briggsae]CAR99023.1 Protein CBG26020 [Caenorhabditis briggsae]
MTTGGQCVLHPIQKLPFVSSSSLVKNAFLSFCAQTSNCAPNCLPMLTLSDLLYTFSFLVLQYSKKSEKS